MIFFTKNPNLFFFFWGGGGGGGSGVWGLGEARVREYFLQRTQILKEIKKFFAGGGGGGRGGTGLE